MKIAGRSRKDSGHPYSRAFTAFGAPIDLTEASLNPATVGGVSPTVGSAATGARHGASGLLVFPTANGTLTYKDAAGVSVALAIVAASTPFMNLPVCVTEITSCTGATTIVAYWDD